LEFGYRPEDDPKGLVLQHFDATVKSKRQIVVKPGIVLESGATLTLLFDPPAPDPTDPDLSNINFIQSTAYDDFGRKVGETRSYYDEKGRSIQTQSRSLSKGVILATETEYDAYGRPALTTLPAPVASEVKETTLECGEELVTIQDIQFGYKAQFNVNRDGKNYDVEDYDRYFTFNSSNNPLDQTRVNDPAPVGNTTEGTLGWYYSQNNGSASANSQMNEPLTAITDYPYSRTIYHEDGKGMTKGATIPGDAYAMGQGHIPLQDHLPVTASDAFLQEYLDIREDELGIPATNRAGAIDRTYRQYAVDPDGRQSIVYVSGDGQGLISLYFGTNDTTDAPILKSYEFYNDRGQQVCRITPNGVRQYESGVAYADIDKTTYEYNWKGFLTAVNEPDAGRSEFRYARDGRVRFSQDAEQKERGAFSYTDYDGSLRPIESGEYAPNASGTYQWDNQELLALLNEQGASGQLSDEQGRKVSVKTTRFDVPVSLPEGYESFQQNFVMGAVSSSSYSGDGQEPTVSSYFSYDERGRTEWMLQEIAGLGTKLIEYRYDENSNVKEVAYQRGQPDAYFHYYEYDADTRLKSVYSGVTAPQYNALEEITNRNHLTHQAGYDYYLTGALKEVFLPQVNQTQVFTYTVDGKLKGINWNTPSGLGQSETVEDDAFGMVLDYHPNDYASSVIPANAGISNTAAPDQYSGNIKAQQWHSPVDGNQTKAYAYEYDKRQQLKTAQFGGATGGVFSPSNDYRVEISGYDENGNIKALVRNGENGQVLHDLAYYYQENTNRLDSVYNNGKLLGKYVYDEIGRLMYKQENNKEFYYDYNVMSRVTGVFRDSLKAQPVLTNEYDDRGFRLSKTVYDTTTHQPTFRTWYVRHLDGTEVSVYVENIKDQKVPLVYEVPIKGASRLGFYRPVEQMNLYEFKDHLSNVRAVIGATETVNYLATMEDFNEVEEAPYFELKKVVTVASHLNHTADANASKAVRINNALDADKSPIGAGQTLSVFTGDTIRAKVFAKYEDFDGSQNNVMPLMADYLSSNLKEVTSLEGAGKVFNGL
ncbi:MAG: hypothetical protein AAGA66_20160, partial [Bacteroidota bacterium]